jgi:hypothetical protein
MKKHNCKEANYCSCYSQALEPDEDCTVHGVPYPPRCADCGRFIKMKDYKPDDSETLFPDKPNGY